MLLSTKKSFSSKHKVISEESNQTAKMILKTLSSNYWGHLFNLPSFTFISQPSQQNSIVEPLTFLPKTLPNTSNDAQLLLNASVQR